MPITTAVDDILIFFFFFFFFHFSKKISLTFHVNQLFVIFSEKKKKKDRRSFAIDFAFVLNAKYGNPVSGKIH